MSDLLKMKRLKENPKLAKELAKLPPEVRKLFMKGLGDKDLKTSKLFSGAVNTFVTIYNVAKRKKVPPADKNRARASEKHQPILLDNGALTVANFSGPGTQLIARIKEQLKKKGKVRGIANKPTDNAALLHDIDYAMAGNEPDQKKRGDMVRKADKDMLKNITKAQLKGEDNKFNLTGALAIAGKVGGEKLGLLAKDKFAPFKKLSDADMKLLNDVKKELNENLKFGGFPPEQAKQSGEGLISDLVDRIQKEVKGKSDLQIAKMAEKEIRRRLKGGQFGDPEGDAIELGKPKKTKSKKPSLFERLSEKALKLVGKIFKNRAKAGVKQLDKKKQGGGARKPNPWLAHVKKVRATMPKGIAYKKVLIEAKKSYKK
jgi:hypothetical protein